MIADTKPLALEPLPPRIRALLGALTAALLLTTATATYLVRDLMTDFEVFSPAVCTAEGKPLGPTPHDDRCARRVEGVFVWQCDDRSVFERHRPGVALWLWAFGPNGFEPSES